MPGSDLKPFKPSQYLGNPQARATYLQEFLNNPADWTLFFSALDDARAAVPSAPAANPSNIHALYEHHSVIHALSEELRKIGLELSIQPILNA